MPYTREGEVWDVHGRRDEGVDFIFSLEVNRRCLGRGGVVREFEVEISRVGIENEVFEILGW